MKMIKAYAVGFLLLSVGLAFSLYAGEVDVDDFDRQEIERRIEPIGRVHVEGGTAKKAENVVNKETSKVPGQATYEGHCVVCHEAGVAGAPKFRNAGDWQPRFDKNKLDGLVANAIKGLNAMPPKGTCAECTDEEIKQAIQYMLPPK